MKKHILFVDDEPMLLQGIRRMLWPLREEWEMFFAEDGHSALQILRESPIDVIVSDMCMPGMDGAELLQNVLQRFPHVIRIMLSGDSDQERVLRSVMPTHMFLIKPCDTTVLKQTVDRASRLKKLLNNADIANIANGIVRLPSIPLLYMNLLHEIQSASPSLARIGEIISQDLGMSAKILQLVNSAFFSLPNHIKDPRQAVNLLGLNIIKALVLYVNLFFGEDCFASGLSTKDIGDHSMQVGSLAGRIYKLESKNAQLESEVLCIGFLHDIGSLILNQFPQYRRIVLTAEKEAESSVQLNQEKEMFGTTHAEIGAYLLGIWGLPDHFIENVAFHHHPSSYNGQHHLALTALHVAENLVTSGYDTAKCLERLDQPYFENIDLPSKLEEWANLC
ncbi:response regulator [Dehalobacter sp. DCM]|uniref:response regulator n=1 Tax=Dehalobacter sp. DCM TaxID=2907827 RepID=UPI00308171F8|nr:response regulator [Dehalobacter sp. DCM]